MVSSCREADVDTERALRHQRFKREVELFNQPARRTELFYGSRAGYRAGTHGGLEQLTGVVSSICGEKNRGFGRDIWAAGCQITRGGLAGIFDSGAVPGGSLTGSRRKDANRGGRKSGFGVIKYAEVIPQKLFEPALLPSVAGAWQWDSQIES